MKNTIRLRSFLSLAGSSLLAISSANAQTWDNSNVNGTPTSPLDWFTGGPNTQGTWTGGTPVSGSATTIQIFNNVTTALTNSAPSSQTTNINNGGAAFQLGTLTLSGLGSATTGRPLTMTISGDALNFSAATSTINLNGLIGVGTSNITHNVNSNIQLGTASTVGALTITGNGTNVFNIGGIISELQTGGGSLTKNGSSTVSLNNGNTYTGRTTITQGVLLLNHATALPGGIGSTGGTNNLAFNGGGTNITVLGLGNGDFSRPLGAVTVTGAVTFTNNGGWAAYGADRTVNLGGAGAPITWADANTGFNAKTLILGATGATHTVTLTNDLNLTTGNRTVIAGDGSALVDGILSGNIASTTSGGGLTKTGSGNLALSGTNTYSGKTTVGGGFPSPGPLTFQGKQAVSPNTTFETRQNSGSTARLVFLDDSAGLISLNNSWTFVAENRQDTSANTHIFVGNNSTANGGNNPGSTQTGSTIALGAFISAPSSTVAPSIETINITGANGYKLQLASLAFPNLTSKAVATTYTMTMNPTTAPLIVAGGVTPFASGNLNSTPIIALGGTATGNEIQGVIADPSNVGTSNPLRLTKSSTSTWTLSGTNTYTGTTAITGGTLVARSATALGLTTTADVSVATQTSLVYNASTNAALAIGGTLGVTGGTLTRIGTSIGTTATGTQINVTEAATISNAAHKIDIYGLNTSSAHFIGLTTLIQGGAGSSLNPTTVPTLGTVYNNTDFTVGAFTRSATALQITTVAATPLTTGAFYIGNLSGNTNVWAASNGTTASNFSLTSGGTAAAVVPGSGADVTIDNSSVATSTVLGSDMSIKSLTISDNTNNFALNADGYGLTIGTGGITKSNTTTRTATIASNIVLGANQTWSNSDTGNALVVSGNVTGAGNLIVGGAGTLALNGNNTYTGTTTVSDGNLVVNGNISTSVLTTVQTGATLGGTGTIGALTVNSGGFHTPGNSPGIQNTGDYSNAGTLGIEIDGVTVGTNYDQVNTTGSVTLSGLLAVTMGYTPAANALFFILANDLSDAITGTFSNASTDGGTYTLGGQQFQISYFGNQTSPGVGTFTGGNDVVLMAVVPEPRAALLGGLGMLMLLRRRRR